MNKIKHVEFEIPKKNPFKNCQLEREKYAVILTQLLEGYTAGFVMAINNEWGTGKTTFVRMWNQMLINKGFKTILFNAWENDIEGDPMIAFLSEIKSLMKGAKKEKFTNVVKKAAILGKNVVPVILNSLISRHTNSESLKELISKTTDAGFEILENDIDQYSLRKQNIKDFKIELSLILAEISKDKPLIIFVDELDRCKPSYAVELLESIKHLFSIPNIIFVLSIDKEQLCHAVRGFYGSEQINSEEYLRRFIDYEYSLPFPEMENFYNYLYSYYSFDDHYKSRNNSKSPAQDKQALTRTFSAILSDADLTLRQQEKLIAQTRVTLRTYDTEWYSKAFSPSLTVYLIFEKNTNLTFYNGIKKKELTLQTICDRFEPLALSYEDKNTLAHVEAELIVYYNNSLKLIGKGSEFFYPDSDKPLVIPNSSINQEKFQKHLKQFSKDYYKAEMNIDAVLDTIDLLTSIKT